MTHESDRRGYRPGVGIMVINRAGLVWIGRRAGSPVEAEGPGRWWQMPQGGIAEGEDPPAAALRELREETGMKSVCIVAELPEWQTYDLPAGLARKSWGGRYRGQRQKWFAGRFFGEDGEIDLAQAGHEIEFEAWRWAPLSELLDLVVPFKSEVYAAVLRAFAPLAKSIGA